MKRLIFLLVMVVNGAMADVNSSLPPMSNANTGNVDACLNNPNIYVQQSCEQNRAALQAQRNQANNATGGGAASQPQVPAWQQALDHSKPASGDSGDTETSSTTP